MSQALAGVARETRERRGLGSHTRSVRGAVLEHHTRSLQPHITLGDGTTVPALWMSKLRLREAKLFALDTYTTGKRFESRPASLEKDNK